MKSSPTLPKPAKKKTVPKKITKTAKPLQLSGEPKEAPPPDHHTELEEHFEEYEMSKSPGS
jgi:hypothetical protein